MRYIVGFDIGGPKCAVTLGLAVKDGAPEILDKIKFAPESDRPYSVLERFKSELDGFVDLSYLKVYDLAISF